jgi:hypothetical protein
MWELGRAKCRQLNISRRPTLIQPDRHQLASHQTLLVHRRLLLASGGGLIQALCCFIADSENDRK